MKYPGFQEFKIRENYPANISDVLKSEFTRIQGSIYVDHAASTLYSEKQLEEIFSTFKSLVFSNPHSKHLPSDLTTEAIESIRNRILNYFNTNSEEYEVIFTSSATEAIKTVGNYFVWNESKAKDKFPSVYAYTEENHTSVLGLRETANAKGAQVYCIEIDKVEQSLCPRNKSINANNSNLQVQNCLFAYPAQSNYSGRKFPLSWISKIQNGFLNIQSSSLNSDKASFTSDFNKRNCEWFVLLDAASFVATSVLDLSLYKPDFVPVSFYKIFGYPTGLGCLLVGKRAWKCLHKQYFGGGTVQMADSKSMALQRRESIHEKFEDGTLPFLDIISLDQGFNTLLRITGGMENVERHVFNLSRYFIYNLRSLKHGNGAPVVEIYSRRNLTKDNHGSIVNFNLKYSNGSFVGYSQVEKVSSLYNIYLRTGCVCNPGGCQKYLDISSDKMKKQFEAGHVCGDSNDLVDGCPTGSIRVSFGYMSSYEDVEGILKMIKECFIDGELVFDSTWYSSKKKLGFLCNNSESNFARVSDTTVSEVMSIESETVSKYSDSSNIKETLENSCSSVETIEKLNWTNRNGVSVKSLVLTDIIIYPVKSCAGLSVSQWQAGFWGLKYDRQWAIVSSSGVTLTMKRYTSLSLLKPWIEEENNVLVLSYEGFGSVSTELELPVNTTSTDSTYCSGRVCGDKINGIDCGNEVSAWLSSILGMSGVRLIRQIQPRKCKLLKYGTKAREELSLANESQYLSIHKASLRHLLKYMTENQFQNVTLNEDELKLRFRPNFVFEGGLPYEEDEWKSFIIDNFHFRVLGHCNRCQMVNVDPETGERSKEPMLSLGKSRGPAMPFGIHASFMGYNGEKDNFLKVGMIVYPYKAE